MKQSYCAIPLLFLAAAIQNANATAIANPDSATMVQGSGSIIIDVLANDTSTDTESDVFISTNDSTSAAYGSIVLNNDNTLTYTPPDENFTGTDTFSYFAVDESGYGGSAIVTVEVTAAPVEPEVPSSLVPYVTGRRNKAVAAMLDDVCSAGELSNALGSGCAQLYAQIDEEGDMNAVVAEIAPDEALTQRHLLTENSRNKTSRLYRSLSQLRSGGGSANLTFNNNTLVSGGAAGSDLNSPWTLLSSIQVEDFEHTSTQDETGYDSNALGFMLGLNYRLDGNLNVGAAFDWTSYALDYVNKGGNLDSDIYGVTGFLSWYSGALSLDLQAGYSVGNSKTQRRFISPAQTYANSDYDSDQLSLSTQIEWAWQPGAWALRPFLRFDYLDNNIDGFTETGNSVWLMSAAKQSQEQINSSAGLDTSYTMSFPWGVMIPGVRLSLVNQANLHSDPVAFQLAEADSTLGSFQLHTNSPDSLFYQWDINAVFVLTNGLSSFISIQTVSSYENVSSQQFGGGINWEF